MPHTPHPLHQEVHTALKHYDNLGRLETNALTSLYAIWPLPADHWHKSLAAPRRGIALRRFIDSALDQLAMRLPDEHALLVDKYRYKKANLTLQTDYNIARATLHNRLNDAVDAFAAEIATLDELATTTARQRLAAQTAFLPGYAPDTIVGLDALLDTFLAALRQRLSQPRTPILITGLGGIGKTTLLDTGLRLWLLQEAPSVAGVLYVRVATADRSQMKSSADILNAILIQLSVQLDTPLVDPATPSAGLSRLAAHLTTRENAGVYRYVIVLDDIETMMEHEVALRLAEAMSGTAIVILASRQNPEFPKIRSTVVRVQELNKRASAALVRAIRATADIPMPPFAPADVNRIVTTVGGHPLALGLVVAQVGLGRLTLDQVLIGLRETGVLAEQLYDHIYERSWSLLSDLAKKVLAWFTNFPTAGVTSEALQVLKTISDDGSTRMIERAIGELSILNLLQRTTRPREGLALHRLTYEFVEYKTARRTAEHEVVEEIPNPNDDFFFAE
jgi:hypothetical protein